MVLFSKYQLKTLITVLCISSNATAGTRATRTSQPYAMKSPNQGNIKGSYENFHNQNLNKKLLTNAIEKTPIQPLRTNNARFSRALANGYDDEIGFDITSYSLKYDKCASILTWSDELAEDEDAQTVFRLQKFVFLRLYPSDKCNDNFRWGFGREFGEYIIDLEKYLEIRREFEEENLESYCNFCEECMQHRQLDENVADDNLGDDAVDDVDNDADDDVVAVDDVAAFDDMEADEAAADDAANDAQNDNTNDDAMTDRCSYNNQCQNYQTKCSYYNDDKAFEYEFFFSCQLFEGDDGDELYIGPHCNGSGAIVLSAFYDDKCSQLASDMDIESFTGLRFSDDGLVDFTSTNCISCKKSDSPYANDDDDDNANAILDLCENAYYESAKCNKRIGGIYNNENEMDEEEKVCTYIENIAHNKYNEDGSIRLNTFHYSDITVIAKNIKESATENQIKALSVSITLSIVFAFYATYLYRKIKRMRSNGEIEWKDSGIGETRSNAFEEDYAAYY